MEADETDVIEKVWTVNPAWKITLRRSPKRIKSGRRVRFTGAIKGHRLCGAGQIVRLRAQQSDGRGLLTLATVVSRPNGHYWFGLRVQETRRYRVETPKNRMCSKAKSKFVRVQIRRPKPKPKR